jgi:hypothetical protein
MKVAAKMPTRIIFNERSYIGMSSYIRALMLVYWYSVFLFPH